MHELFDDFIERLIEETGYDYDYIIERWNVASAQGVRPDDFFENMVDGALFGV